MGAVLGADANYDDMCGPSLSRFFAGASETRKCESYSPECGRGCLVCGERRGAPELRRDETVIARESKRDRDCPNFTSVPCPSVQSL